MSSEPSPEFIPPDSGSPLPLPEAAPVDEPNQLPFPHAPAPGPLVIPYARPAGFVPPVITDDALPAISKWRAVLDVVLIAAAYIAGATVVVPLQMLWSPRDERWFGVVMTLASGTTVMAICIILLKTEQQRARSIGWTSKGLPLNILIGISTYVGAFIAMAVFMVGLSMLFPDILKGQERTVEAIRSAFPDMHIAVAAVFMTFVAFWEEIAFRGVLLSRLQRVLNNWWLTVPAGALLFGLGHLWQGPSAAFQITFLGLILGALFVWRRSLVPCIVWHAINNIMSFVLIKAAE